MRRCSDASSEHGTHTVFSGSLAGRFLLYAMRTMLLGFLLAAAGTTLILFGYQREVEMMQEMSSSSSQSSLETALKQKSLHHPCTYIGSIVAGIGCFLVVVACVITFEAREWSSKVKPSQLLLTTAVRVSSCSRHVPASIVTGARQSVGTQTPWLTSTARGTSTPHLTLPPYDHAPRRSASFNSSACGRRHSRPSLTRYQRPHRSAACTMHVFRSGFVGQRPWRSECHLAEDALPTCDARYFDTHNAVSQVKRASCVELTDGSSYGAKSREFAFQMQQEAYNNFRCRVWICRHNNNTLRHSH